jgi:hypothetical protein
LVARQGQQGVAAHDGADRLQKRAGRRAFAEEAAGTGSQGREDVLVLLEDRQDQYSDAGQILVLGDRRVAAIPSGRGMRISIRTISARVSRARRTASRPSGARDHPETAAGKQPGLGRTAEDEGAPACR